MVVLTHNPDLIVVDDSPICWNFFAPCVCFYDNLDPFDEAEDAPSQHLSLVSCIAGLPMMIAH